MGADVVDIKTNLASCFFSPSGEKRGKREQRKSYILTVSPPCKGVPYFAIRRFHLFTVSHRHNRPLTTDQPITFDTLLLLDTTSSLHSDNTETHIHQT